MTIPNIIILVQKLSGHFQNVFISFFMIYGFSIRGIILAIIFGPSYGLIDDGLLITLASIMRYLTIKKNKKFCIQKSYLYFLFLKRIELFFDYLVLY